MLTRLGNLTNRSAEVACSVMVLTMALVVATQVICRYLLGASLTWSEEASRYLLIWITFLGGSIAFKRGMHTGFDAVVRALSPGARREKGAEGGSEAEFLTILLAPKTGPRQGRGWSVAQSASAASIVLGRQE